MKKPACQEFYFLKYNRVMGTQYRKIEEPDELVLVRQLINGTMLPCDMFIKENDTFKLLFNREVLYTKISEDILKEKGISEVYIFKRDVPNFDSYISRNRSLNRNRDVDSSGIYKEYAFQKEKHYQIDAAVLTTGTNIHFSLFVVNKLNFSPLVEATDQHPAVVNDSVLKIAGDVVIKKSDVPLYLEYISSMGQYSKHLENTDTKIKAIALRETSKAVLQNFLDDPKSGEKIKEV